MGGDHGRVDPERLRSLLDVTSDAVFCWECRHPFPVDAPVEAQVEALFDAYLADCNDVAARAYGFAKAADVIGRDLVELLAPDREVQARLFRAYVEAGYRVEDGLVVRKEEERDRHFLNNAFGVVEDGLHLRTWGTAREITKQVELEASVRQAQKLEAVGRLASGIAHDFNNLLTTIHGSLDLFLDDPDGDRSPLYDAQDAVERASGLARRLLGLSRRQAAQPRLVDVRQLVEDLQPLLRRALERRQSLRVELSNEPAPVVVDPAQLEQGLLNLVLNARDACAPTGHVSVSVEAGQQVRLRVKDDGQGMTEAVRARAFEPFFTTKPEGHGTGLGLATLHQVVTESGGTVSVESAPAQGCDIVVSLPRAQGTAAPMVRTSGGPVPGGKERVLVVDDEAPLREAFRRILDQAGYRVEVAASADEARQCWARAPFDLLVADVVMPNEGGLALAQTLREGRARPPVVFVSGFAERSSDAKAMSDSLFLAKPCAPRDLLEAVRYALDQPP